MRADLAEISALKNEVARLDALMMAVWRGGKTNGLLSTGRRNILILELLMTAARRK